MPDIAFCQACLILAQRCVGAWETSPDAPDDFDTLVATYLGTGRMVVTDRWSPEDHPAFDSPETYAAFRAWHDWLHVTYRGAFDLTGECQMVALHELQLRALGGNPAWSDILRYELIENNFGTEAACPPLS